jgi:serine/threonine protein kinase
MAAHLLVIAGPDKGRTFPFPPDRPLVVGRGRQTATALSDLHVSRVHCRLSVRGPHLVIEDLQSAGGTFVNDLAVREGVVRAGDVIRVGETLLRLEVEDDVADEATLPPEPPGARAPPKAAAPPPVLPGERLGELAGTTLAHFRVGPVLATGRSGVVFDALDLRGARAVALKVLRPELARDPHEVRRFVRAMRTTLPLRHPNLVRLFGAGKKGPYCWAAMDLIEGESLTQVIGRIGVAGMLDWRHAFRAAVHVGRALDYAHSRAILHRNLTPQNVLVRAADGVVLLGDLMLAKALEGALAQGITRAGEILGDVRYVSPEQAMDPQHADARSDLYSLGALVYALLTGRPPFEGATLMETLVQVRTARPEPPRKFQLSIPGAFEGIVLSLLAKRPEDRPATAAGVVKALLRVGKYHGVRT